MILAALAGLALGAGTGDLMQQADAGAWRLVMRTEDAEIYIDPGTLRRDGTMFTIREKLVLAQPRHGIHMMVVLVRFDCVRRTHMLMHQVQIDPDGRVLYDADSPAPYERNTSAGTPPDAILTEFCPPSAEAGPTAQPAIGVT